MTLRNCLFCDNSVSHRDPLDTIYPTKRDKSEWKVVCSDCGAHVLAPTKEAAIIKWNTAPVRDFVVYHNHEERQGDHHSSEPLLGHVPDDGSMLTDILEAIIETDL